MPRMLGIRVDIFRRVVSKLLTCGVVHLLVPDVFDFDVALNHHLAG